MNLSVNCVALLLSLSVACSSLAEESDEGAMVLTDGQMHLTAAHSVDATVSEESFLDPDAEEFVPTSEWQTVKKGQAIPHGLHVRLNMETGVNEAKLLDDEEPAPKKIAGDSHGEASLCNNLKAEKALHAVEAGINYQLDILFSTYSSGTLNKQLWPLEFESFVGTDVVSIADSLPGGRLDIMKQAILEAMAELDESQLSEGERPDPEYQYWKAGDREGILNRKKDSFTQKELKEALKKFKANQDDVKDPGVSPKVKGQQFRSMEEIKDDFKEMNLAMKSENEILSDLIKRYQQVALEPEERAVILEDLEYYLHQVDNAVDFCNMGGMALLMDDLNSTVAQVKSQAALALAAAMQSNPAVQTRAMEASVVPRLLHIMASEPQSSVQGRLLYALSSLLRHFPFAQLEFIQRGGVKIFSDIVKKSRDDRLRIKVITLVCDLVVEKQQSHDENPESERSLQYNKVNYLAAVSDDGWCSSISSLLGLPDHDSREKVLRSMKTLQAACPSDFRRSAVAVLRNLSSEYQQLATEEQSSDDNDSFFRDLHSLVEDVLYSVLVTTLPHEDL
ncbi:hypothetical protein CAPTEDRAFT_220900 [Capitella teleta]|uniref:Nucleotide exchange factor SIL1 n=1 Tax=Capitella teleta TaxID=283909 RepID=R7U094_CAPTE|nr:hypothetical protein CAPTEDRAFT_220900 [Capitella teleta]|eukprot:ELT97086.1 hypothetical protein CAPTEDRAFT_220900 [Capitella teleta]